MNAIQDTPYSAAWRQIGENLPRPRAILAVSAHWYVSSTAVTVSAAPRTIHDFRGFPPELFDVQYPAPGDVRLAQRVQSLLNPLKVTLDDAWGLDHGTWSVLRHLYPQADVPVVQLAIDATQPPAFHYQTGQALRALRDEGVMILGSGNVVHNLQRYDWSGKGAPASDWAQRFEQRLKDLILAGDHGPLIDYQRLAPEAMLAIPTPEHYLPLLYVLGSSHADEPVDFPVSGIEGGSVSMLAVALHDGRG